MSQPRGRRTPPSILVIDDDDYVPDALTAALRSLRPAIARASTGAEGIDLARESHPDLAIVDLGLPDIDGYGVTSRLRADLTLAGMRILILTGHLPDEDAARQAGADAILGKPFRLHEFLDTVERLLEDPALTG
jgi:two-component system OmpR family response regulator